MRPVILYEAAFTFCANQSAHTAVRPDGPCQAATYIEGGGYQPAGSSIPYGTRGCPRVPPRSLPRAWRRSPRTRRLSSYTLCRA